MAVSGSTTEAARLEERAGGEKEDAGVEGVLLFAWAGLGSIQSRGRRPPRAAETL